MAKETLPTWPDGWKKENKFKLKMKELIWTLSKPTESKKAECDAKNEDLLNEFKSSFHLDEFGSGYWRSTVNANNVEFVELWTRTHHIREYDTIVFDDLHFDDVKKYLLLLDNIYLYHPIKLEIKHESNRSITTNELKYFLENLKTFKELYLQFNPYYFREGYRSKSIKLLKQFILKNGCVNCYFELLWNEYSSMPSDLKDLITWFTKQWKAWKIKNCIIKANWKEYHSSGDYKYDFK